MGDRGHVMGSIRRTGPTSILTLAPPRGRADGDRHTVQDAARPRPVGVVSGGRGDVRSQVLAGLASAAPSSVGLLPALGRAGKAGAADSGREPGGEAGEG